MNRRHPSRSGGGKNCSFRSSCRWFNGATPENILLEIKYLRKRVNQLEGAVDFGTEQVRQLRERIKELEDDMEKLQDDLLQAKQAPFRKRKKKEPSENPKKRGAPIGHPGWFRKKPEHIDEYINVFLEKCPRCADEKLSSCKHTTRHIQEDIDSGKVRVTCFVHHYYWCPSCKDVVHGWGENEIPNAAVGPDARGKASFLRYLIKISYDDIPRVFKYLCGLTITPGAIVGFDNKVSKKGKPLYEGLKNMLPHTGYMHVDETGWKDDGNPVWLWIFTDARNAFYHIDDHRSANVVREHLGDNYRGILISDFLSTYGNSIEAFAKQKCCAHLLKDIKKLEENGPENIEAKTFLDKLKQLIKDAIFLHSQFSDLPPELWRETKRKIFKRFRKLRKSNPLADKLAENIRLRLVNHKFEILSFLKYPALIEPTNNPAERGLRGMVLFRKLVFGTRSLQGRINVALINTIIRTVQLRMLNPVKVLKTLLTQGVTSDIAGKFGITAAMPQPP